MIHLGSLIRWSSHFTQGLPRPVTQTEHKTWWQHTPLEITSVILQCQRIKKENLQCGLSGYSCSLTNHSPISTNLSCKLEDSELWIQTGHNWDCLSVLHNVYDLSSEDSRDWGGGWLDSWGWNHPEALSLTLQEGEAGCQLGPQLELLTRAPTWRPQASGT